MEKEKLVKRIASSSEGAIKGFLSKVIVEGLAEIIGTASLEDGVEIIGVCFKRLDELRGVFKPTPTSTPKGTVKTPSATSLGKIIADALASAGIAPEEDEEEDEDDL
jgi:hypothetical protein